MVVIFVIGFYYLEIFLNYKKIRKYLIFVLFFIIPIMFYFDSLFFDKLNFYMLSLALEETRQKDYESINNYFELFLHIIKNFMYSFVSFNTLNFFRTFIYIENLFIWIILIYIFIKGLKFNQYMAIYWIISIFVMIGFMDTVVPNFGSLARYKFNIFFIFLIGFYYSMFIRNKNA